MAAFFSRVAGKAGALGSVISAMGCAVCFPALATLGGAIGLGFLAQYPSDERCVAYLNEMK